ncbi:S41 family peptidase [Entomospira entomophila]|uniref:S41 family peptidase n=1 Tax=Entomospira entomophila TaxID=2719988 RepID=A0A968G8K0_9SPIO|nr:S41 family peptidase [Entomospira entomophilus]NIZ40557.1 S41 family peptidase [Entomospira entomophilus]WDI36115.1 S41 family peptidase [Entomospira entomophilus]
MKEKSRPFSFSNEQILFLSVIAVLLVVILLLGITVVRNQFSYKPAATREERYNAQQVQKIEKVYNYILEHYVYEVDAQELLQSAMKGMTEYLDDTYTDYVIESEALHLQDMIKGDFIGIGVKIQVVEMANSEGSHFIVSYVYADSAAEESGIVVGDQFLSINGEKIVTGVTGDEVFAKLRGKAGSKVDLLLLRGEEEITVRVRRAKVELLTVQQAVIQPGLGYIRISQFTPHTVQAVEDALVDLQSQGITQLIIDLRDNPGGELESVVMTTDLFLSRGLIVETKSRSGLQNKIYRANAAISIDESIPIAVLINEQTASAAEVMAATLQDLDRASVYGKRSFGKSSVQVVLPLGSRPLEFLKMTVAHYFTASGKNISLEGITPDYEIDSPYRLMQSEWIRFQTLRKDTAYQQFLQMSPAITSEERHEIMTTFASDWEIPLEFLEMYVAQYVRYYQFDPMSIDINTDYILAKTIEALSGGVHQS